MALFGQYVLVKRKEKGISLRTMASLLGIFPTYLSDIEKGKRLPPKLDRLFKFVEILELNRKEQEKMLDKLALDRDEIPLDVYEYVKGNTDVISRLRKEIRNGNNL